MTTKLQDLASLFEPGPDGITRVLMTPSPLPRYSPEPVPGGLGWGEHHDGYCALRRALASIRLAHPSRWADVPLVYRDAYLSDLHRDSWRFVTETIFAWGEGAEPPSLVHFKDPTKVYRLRSVGDLHSRNIAGDGLPAFRDPTPTVGYAEDLTTIRQHYRPAAEFLEVFRKLGSTAPLWETL